MTLLIESLVAILSSNVEYLLFYLSSTLLSTLTHNIVTGRDPEDNSDIGTFSLTLVEPSLQGPTG